MECSVVVVIVVETAPKPSRFFCSLLARCRIPCACHAKQHLNLQTWSEHVVFLTFWLGNVLRATTACTFSTSQLPKVVFLTFWLGNVLRATTACTFSTSQLPKMVFSTSQLPKVVREWCVLHIMAWKCASRHSGVPGSVLYILAWKCASRRNGEHFFDISTSKSGPRMVCVVHFDFECASRHNGVQFFISHLATWLRTRRFSEPTFRPSGATNHWKKHSVSRLCYLFAHLHLLSSHSFSSLICSLLLFSSLTLPTSAFPSVHIVGSLTYKLPSIIFSCFFFKKGEGDYC